MNHVPTRIFSTGSLLAFAVIGGLATSLHPQPAQAQSALTADEIRGCLCMDQELETRRDDIATRRGMLAERTAQLSALSQQVEARRGALDPQDIVGQELLKSLINQQNALRDLIQSDTRPALNQSVAEYNSLAALYTTECANRPRYKIDADEAAKNLTCPMP